MIDSRTKQEKMLNIFQNFLKLPQEDQVYIGGIVQGMFLQKQKGQTLKETSTT